MNLFGVKYNKKGNAIIDGVTLVVVLVILSLSSIFAYKVFFDMNIDMSQELTGQAKEQHGSLYKGFPSLMDNLFLFAVILLIVFVIVSVFLLNTHPIFFITSVLLLIGVFIAGFLLANAFDDIMLEPEMAQIANSFTYTGWIMGHLVEVIIVIAFLMMIATFAKYRMVT